MHIDTGKAHALETAVKGFMEHLSEAGDDLNPAGGDRTPHGTC